MTRVIAVNAAANRHCAIPVGAGKVDAQADFIYSGGEAVVQHTIKRVEALAMPERVQVDGEIHELEKNG
jgi:hypothetical protein